MLPHSGEAEWGDLPPLGPSSLLHLLPLRPSLSQWVGYTFDLAGFDLVDAATVREGLRWWSKLLSRPCPHPTYHPFCLLGSSLPRAKSRTKPAISMVPITSKCLSCGTGFRQLLLPQS